MYINFIICINNRIKLIQFFFHVSKRWNELLRSHTQKPQSLLSNIFQIHIISLSPQKPVNTSLSHLLFISSIDVHFMPYSFEVEDLVKELGFTSMNRTGLEICLKETGCSVAYIVIDFWNT